MLQNALNEVPILAERWPELELASHHEFQKSFL